MIEIKRLEQVSEEQLNEFFAVCKKLGYNNNISKESLKIGSKDFNILRYDVALKEDKVFAIGGIHDNFIYEGKEYWRTFFRCATLPNINVHGTGKNPSSIHIKEFVPRQIKWAMETFDAEDFILTANDPNKEPIDKAGDSFKVFRIMDRIPWLEQIGKSVYIYKTYQNIWKFNNEQFLNLYG